MVKSRNKKGKKAGGQHKKKSASPDIPWKEALLAYDISLKERALEDSQYEQKQLEDQNRRFKARNRQLKEDQDAAVSKLLKSSRDFDKMLSEKDAVSKEHVIEQMMTNWEVKKVNDRELVELEEQLVKTDEKISRKDSKLSYWTQFRDIVQHDNDKTICLLEQELIDMETSFTEISNHLQTTLSRAKEEIEKTTAEILTQQKYIATEKAIARMDKYGRCEVIDNDWLTRETEIHRQEVVELFHVVEKLENENLKILSELFDCQVEDLHISRNFFMTQFVDNENLSQNTLLDIDMAELTQAHLSAEKHSCEPHASVSIHEDDSYEQQQERQMRPKSAIYQAVENKMFLLEQLHSSQVTQQSSKQSADGGSLQQEVAVREENDSEEEEEEEEEDEDGAEEIKEREYESTTYYDGSAGYEGNDPFLEFHHFDDEDFEDFLKLGPLELKLLSVSGKQMSVYTPPTPEEEIMKMKEVRPDNWPVTVAMLHRTLRQHPAPNRSDVQLNRQVKPV